MRLLYACLLLLAVSLFHNSAARADWATMSAQIKCDGASGTFEILPYWDSSSGSAKIEPGFQVLKPGVSTHSCAFGKRTLRVQIRVVEPNAGHCGASGGAGISSAAIDNVELVDEPILVDDDCEMPGPPIIDISIRYAGGLATLTQCAGPSDNSSTDSKAASGGCESVTMEVDRLSAEYGKIDHNLADPVTQHEQSATKLPSNEDMAKVYEALADSSGTPICAHWGAATGAAGPRYARIAGKVGDKVYIHEANPGLCQRQDDDGCGNGAYVIPGDRVLFRFICGASAYIEYDPRTLATRPTVGWVKTGQLYAVESVKESAATSPSPVPQSPLIAAAFAHDTATIKKLLEAAGEQADPDELPRVLSIAASTGSLDIIDMIVAKGIKPDDLGEENSEKVTALMSVAHTDGRTDSTSSNKDRRRTMSSAEVAKHLIALGASVGARDTWGATPLFWTAESNNIGVARVLLEAGADPNFVASSGDESGYTPLLRAIDWYPLTYDPSLIQLLLDHKADPNFQTGDYEGQDRGPSYAGETALTVAARRGYMTVARLLLDHGANPILPRGDGALPADIADQNHYPKIAALIRQYARNP